jgi:hypothetical protein
MAMIAITTNSSIKVKPLGFGFRAFIGPLVSGMVGLDWRGCQTLCSAHSRPADSASVSVLSRARFPTDVLAWQCQAWLPNIASGLDRVASACL